MIHIAVEYRNLVAWQDKDGRGRMQERRQGQRRVTVERRKGQRRVMQVPVNTERRVRGERRKGERRVLEDKRKA